MKPVRFGAAATEEFRDAARYLELQTEGLGEEFIWEIERAISMLQASPLHYQRIGRSQYRKMLERRLKYHVIYRVMPTYIWIVAIAHTARRPRYWHGRRPPI